MSNPPIALQLYTVREQMASDFAGTLRAVARIGYAGVELAGYGSLSVTQLRDLLRELGLQVAGNHVALDRLERQLDKVLEENLALEVVELHEIAVHHAQGADPGALGTPELARGFPVCSATVTFGGRGYHDMFGWVQLVSSSDNATHGHTFEMDPCRRFVDSSTPYRWYGPTPTLFAAPFPAELGNQSWRVHSFLTVMPSVEGIPSKQVVPLLAQGPPILVPPRGCSRGVSPHRSPGHPLVPRLAQGQPNGQRAPARSGYAPP